AGLGDELCSRSRRRRRGRAVGSGRGTTGAIQPRRTVAGGGRRGRGADPGGPSRRCATAAREDTQVAADPVVVGRCGGLDGGPSGGCAVVHLPWCTRWEYGRVGDGGPAVVVPTTAGVRRGAAGSPMVPTRLRHASGQAGPHRGGGGPRTAVASQAGAVRRVGDDGGTVGPRRHPRSRKAARAPAR